MRIAGTRECPLIEAGPERLGCDSLRSRAIVVLELNAVETTTEREPDGECDPKQQYTVTKRCQKRPGRMPEVDRPGRREQGRREPEQRTDAEHDPDALQHATTCRRRPGHEQDGQHERRLERLLHRGVVDRDPTCGPGHRDGATGWLHEQLLEDIGHHGATHSEQARERCRDGGTAHVELRRDLDLGEDGEQRVCWRFERDGLVPAIVGDPVRHRDTEKAAHLDQRRGDHARCDGNHGCDQSLHGWNGLLVVQNLEQETASFADQAESELTILQAGELDDKLQRVLEQII